MLNPNATRKEFDKFAKYVIQQSKSNLTKGRKNVNKTLYNSLRYEIIENADGLVVEFEMSDYGAFQDEGVKGAKSTYTETRNSPYKYSTKKPPFEQLLNWVRKRKIRFRDEKGRFEEGNYKRIASMIRNSIFNKGIKATGFFSKPFEKGVKKLDQDIVKSVTIDIEKILDK